MHMICELILLSLYVAGCSYDKLCNTAFDLLPFRCRTGIKQCHKIARCRIGCRDTIEIPHKQQKHNQILALRRAKSGIGNNKIELNTQHLHSKHAKSIIFC